MPQQKSHLLYALVLLVAVFPLYGQTGTGLLLKQGRDNEPATNLSAAEFAELADPFFTLVLRDHPDAVTLADIERLLGGSRQTFVVDENILDPRPGQFRRAVVAFVGQVGSEVLNPNIMLSLLFDSEEFPDDPPFIEAWGWDNRHGRYNYYKLDRSGTPDSRLSWKFRGSSSGADALSPTDRRGTCMGCHINGAPLMKELARPWNNWHSFDSRARYLRSTSPNAWTVAAHPRIKDQLTGAEELETAFLLDAITQFNGRRITAALARTDRDGNVALDAQGNAQILDGRRLLRSLFETTEFNVASALQTSNLHPLPTETDQGPSEAVVVPASFLVNSRLLGGDVGLRGLALAEARALEGAVILQPDEYKNLVVNRAIRLAGRIGDAGFAWLTPEASHIDTSMVDQLLKRGVVTPEFVAAILAIDLETPILSDVRTRLLRFVPDRFSFPFVPAGGTPASGRHPDQLTRTVIDGLRAENPAAGTPEAELLRRLVEPDPVALLRQNLADLRTRIMSRLAVASTRGKELERLFDRLLQVRSQVLEHEVLGTLNETGDRLFPLAETRVRFHGGEVRTDTGQ